MSGIDQKESRKALRILYGVSVLGALFVALIALGAATTLPGISSWVAETFDSGIGLRKAAIVSAIVSVLVLIVFAVASGDGLVGEIQFMISGFFGFFVFFWLLIAWVF